MTGGFTFTGSSQRTLSELDYSRKIRQKQDEIIELVHAYNKSKKKLPAESAQSFQGKTGFASSSTVKVKSLKIIDFRRLLLS